MLLLMIYLLALFVASPSFAAPIPQSPWTPIQQTSPFVTRFTQRVPSNIQSRARAFAARIPILLGQRPVEREDIFLARALEDPIFISVRRKSPALAARRPRKRSGSFSIGNQLLDIATMIPEGDEFAKSTFIDHVESVFATRAPEERRRLAEDLGELAKSLEELG